ncbi:MAG: ribonuclease P protein component [Acidimicrobiia bacterium]
MPVRRVRDGRTFRALERDGSRARAGAVTVTALIEADEHSSDAPPRVAYAVSRRVGPAVVRNLVRRRLRAIVSDIGLPPGAAYLISAGPAAARTPYSVLRSQVVTAVGTLARP